MIHDILVKCTRFGLCPLNLVDACDTTIGILASWSSSPIRALLGWMFSILRVLLLGA